MYDLPLERTGKPLPRQASCTGCPHEHHLLACDATGCTCSSPPIPGIP